MSKESGNSFLGWFKRTEICLLTVLLLLFLSYFFGASAEAAVRYVRWNAAGVNDGTSWTNAYTDLQAAISAASSLDEIWVAAGTYKPTSSIDRTISFPLKTGLAIYGGFSGTETARNQRNFTTNVTTLSGDIGTVGDNSDNSYHVVTGTSVDGTAILDGFTITGGNATGGILNSYYGGGIFNLSSSPTLTNLIFSGNSASYGGGILNYTSSPTVTNVTLSGNSAQSGGGGMVNINGSNPNLTNVTFSGNSASTYGGGLMNHTASSPSLTNVTFSGNSVSRDGGGMYSYNFSSPTLTNVTFSGNIASGFDGETTGWGAGMYNYYYSSPSLTNVTFNGNTADREGGGIYNSDHSNPTVKSSILWGNTAPLGAQVINFISSAPTINYGIVQDGCPAGSTCSNLINTTDPLLGTLGNYGGYTRTIPLLSGSPAIDTIPVGTNGCGTTLTADQRGVIRPQGSQCDLGAYEFATHIEVLSAVTGEVITLDTNTPGCAFTSWGTRTAADVGGDPFHTYPYGLVEFVLDCSEAGISADVTITFPGDISGLRYRKYGPTPHNPTPHWYDFMYNGTTGAEINGNQVILHFVDGQRGDDDLTADGKIGDDGGPGDPAASIPTMNEWGMIMFMILAGLGAVCYLRRQRRA